MQEATIDFTTVTKSLIECMTMNDRDSSHGFSFPVPNRIGTQYAAKIPNLDLKRVGSANPLKLETDCGKAINNVVENAGKPRFYE